MNKLSLENSGTINKNLITIGNLKIWFSYETPVAFKLGYEQLICRKNDWNITTGKLLNEICPNHKERISGEKFEKELNTLLKKLNLTI